MQNHAYALWAQGAVRCGAAAVSRQDYPHPSAPAAPIRCIVAFGDACLLNEKLIEWKREPRKGQRTETETQMEMMDRDDGNKKQRQRPESRGRGHRPENRGQRQSQRGRAADRDTSPGWKADGRHRDQSLGGRWVAEWIRGSLCLLPIHYQCEREPDALATKA